MCIKVKVFRDLTMEQLIEEKMFFGLTSTPDMVMKYLKGFRNQGYYAVVDADGKITQDYIDFLERIEL